MKTRKPLPTFESYDDTKDYLIWIEVGYFGRNVPKIVDSLNKDDIEHYVTTMGVLIPDWKSQTSNPEKYRQTETFLEGDYTPTMVTMTENVVESREVFNKMPDNKIKQTAEKVATDLKKKYPDYVDFNIKDINIVKQSEGGETYKELHLSISSSLNQIGGKGGSPNSETKVQFRSIVSDYTYALHKAFK